MFCSFRDVKGPFSVLFNLMTPAAICGLDTSGKWVWMCGAPSGQLRPREGQASLDIKSMKPQCELMCGCELLRLSSGYFDFSKGSCLGNMLCIAIVCGELHIQHHSLSRMTVSGREPRTPPPHTSNTVFEFVSYLATRDTQNRISQGQYTGCGIIVGEAGVLT